LKNEQPLQATFFLIALAVCFFFDSFWERSQQFGVGAWLCARPQDDRKGTPLHIGKIPNFYLKQQFKELGSVDI
jgi:hypothetical protein